ncbi:MAG: hypothetical protein WA140_07935 [Geobacteraceae bacterium]
MLNLNKALGVIEVAEPDIYEIYRSTGPVTISLSGHKTQPCEAFICSVVEDDTMSLHVALQLLINKQVLVFLPDKQPKDRGDYAEILQEAISFVESMGFSMASVNLNFSKALREVVVRDIRALRLCPQRKASHKHSHGGTAHTLWAAKEKEVVLKAAAEQAETERRAVEETQVKRLTSESAGAGRHSHDGMAHTLWLAKEKETALKAAAEQAKMERQAAEEEALAERLAAEQVEAKRLADEQAEMERLAAEEKALAERLAAEKAETERLAAEKAVAERLAEEQAEAKRIADEQAETERQTAEEKALAERLAAEKAEAESPAVVVDPVPAQAPTTEDESDPFAFLTSSGQETNGKSAFEPPGPAAMFSLDKSISCVEYEQTDEIVELHSALNMPRINVADEPPQNCSAYICAVKSNGSIRVCVALHLAASGKALVYLPDSQPTTRPEMSKVINDAVEFAETVGFMMHEVTLDADPSKRLAQLAKIPVFKFV